MRKALLITIFSLVVFSCWSQYQSRGKEFNFIDAEHFFYNNNFNEALALYELLIVDYPKIKSYQLKKGMCCIQLNNPKEAISAILQSKDKKKEPEDYLYYLAKAYALNYQFDSAIYFFKEAKSSSNVLSELKKTIPHLLDECKNGEELMKDKLDVKFVNIGAPINTADYEYSPVINNEETILAYTYRGSKSTGGRQGPDGSSVDNGNFYDDVYVSYKDKGNWGEPEKLNRKINTNRNETSVSISASGDQLYVYRSTTNKSGELYAIDNEKGEYIEMKDVSINSSDWEGSISVSSDGKFAIFSSDRPGGKGGSDLYYVEKNGSGWGEPVNMGNDINTEYEEEVPFIYPNNKMFSFSSQGHNSMGGYDIFESHILDKNEYSKPRNVGFPISSTFDDLFFSLTGVGNGFYSTIREGGKGQYDVYSFDVEPMMEQSLVLLLKGNLSPKESKIIVKNTKGEDRGEYYTDPKTGNYRAYLPLGEDYVVSYLSGEKEIKKIDVSAKNLKVYTVIEENIEGEKVVVENNTPAPKLKFDLSNAANYDLFVKTYGDKTAQDVSFFVQIGAYSDPSFFNFKKWNKLGEVTQVKLSDGITRFTIGTYDTYLKAVKITEKAKKIGDQDAFVLVYYKGERTSLNKLIAQGVYKF